MPNQEYWVADLGVDDILVARCWVSIKRRMMYLIMEHRTEDPESQRLARRILHQQHRFNPDDPRFFPTREEALQSLYPKLDLLIEQKQKELDELKDRRLALEKMAL